MRRNEGTGPAIVLKMEIDRRRESKETKPITTHNRGNDTKMRLFAFSAVLALCVRRLQTVGADPVLPVETANTRHNLEDRDGSLLPTLDEIRTQLKCHEVFSVQRPIHSQETWAYLRQTYQDVVGVENSTIGPPKRPYNGFSVPYYVDQSPNKGRGLFAAHDIPKGSLIWSAIRTAEFKDAEMYRRFLFALPADLACDVSIWAYVEEASYLDESDRSVAIDTMNGDQYVGARVAKVFEVDDEEEGQELILGTVSSFDRVNTAWQVQYDDGDDEIFSEIDLSMGLNLPLRIMVDLDESSFCNDGRDSSNSGWLEESAEDYGDGFELKVFATKPIKAGEEILCDYDGFHVYNGWKYFGLQSRSEAEADHLRAV